MTRQFRLDAAGGQALLKNGCLRGDGGAGLREM
jgi:hypothetical protein